MYVFIKRHICRRYFKQHDVEIQQMLGKDSSFLSTHHLDVTSNSSKHLYHGNKKIVIINICPRRIHCN